jgi:hypothetical protein
MLTCTSCFVRQGNCKCWIFIRRTLGMKTLRLSSAIHKMSHSVFSPFTSYGRGRGARGGAVGWDTALQVGRSRVRFRPHYGPGVGSASNRDEYGEYFLGDKGGRSVGLTTLPPPCADCLEVWEPQPPGAVRACAGLWQGLRSLLLPSTSVLSVLCSVFCAPCIVIQLWSTNRRNKHFSN